MAHSFLDRGFGMNGGPAELIPSPFLVCTGIGFSDTARTLLWLVQLKLLNEPLSVMGFPFAQVVASPLVGRLASQRGRIEFAFTTDDSVRLPLRSTPPHGDAVTVSYHAGVGLPEENLHLLEQNTLARAPTPAEPGDLPGY
jgi:hypothetical protein